MMMLKLECKRILKTRLTMALLAVSLLCAVLLAFIPTTFSAGSYVDENGQTVTVSGLDAVRYEQALQAETAGSVTSERVRQAVEAYQACLGQYGVDQSYDLPEGVYETEIRPYAPLLHGVKEAFADRETGIAPTLMEVDPTALDDYYTVCEQRLASLIRMEQGDDPAAQNAAAALYGAVEKPYSFYPGANANALDYQILLAFLILLFCTVIAAPVFTSDYQTGADDILRCTRHGRRRLGRTRVLATLLLSAGTFGLCAVVYILVSDSLYGWECTKTSMQMLYSVVTLAALNLGQLQWTVALVSLLSLLAAVSLTLFLSSKIKNMVAVLAASLLFCLLPLMIYLIAPGDVSAWLCGILPAGGVGLQTSILYALTDFAFVKAGGLAIWTPFLMIGAYIIEIPLFSLLAIRAYRTHSLH